MMTLTVKDIKKSFNEKEVLKGAGYTFEKGHIYGLLGKNGAGKTTLFNCISGELPCDGGMAVINDGSRERQLQPEQVGFAYSTPVLPDFLTGYESGSQ